MSFSTCMRNGFRCDSELNKWRTGAVRWSPFDDLKPIWEVGRKVQMHEVYSSWRQQMGTNLDNAIITATASKVPLVLHYAGDTMYAIPQVIMATIMMRTQYINRIAYDGPHATAGDKRPEWDHDCKDYATRFMAEFEGSMPELGYHMTMVGCVDVPNHRRNVYLCSDDMKWHMVEKTRKSTQWLANPANTGDRVLRVTL